MMSSSSIDKKGHLLVLFTKEAIEGNVKPTMASDVSARESNYLYQCLVLTLLKQLKGLTNTDILFVIRPPDAIEAVKFWILSELEGTLLPTAEDTFQFTPEDDSDSYLITFIADKKEQLQSYRERGVNNGYQTVSLMGTNCPDCGSRWIHMAQLLAFSKNHEVIGKATDGSIYLSTSPASPKGILNTPKLPKVKSGKDWEHILNSPLGGKLRTIYKKITGVEAK